MKDGKFVVLCIDDDDDVLLSLRMVLEKNGYSVVEARSGEDGLSIYKKESPDFVIVDLMMEEVDSGAKFVKELRATAGPQALPAIFLLSSVGDSLSEEADYSDLGLAGVFQKPVDPRTLLDTLKAKLN